MSWKKTRYKMVMAYHSKKFSKSSVVLNKELCTKCGIFMDILGELRKKDGDPLRGLIWKCRRCRQTFLGKTAIPKPT